ncbi:hypothetical protein J4462_02645 [Candidatus Pacearchaeota archaeon]|nr:hypothetical protein [Candidatus Pacearchaeota archaeon]
MDAEAVYETMRNYFNDGGNPVLFDKTRPTVDEVTNLLIDKGRIVFPPSNRPSRVRSSRSLTSEEISAIYSTLDQRLVEAIEALNSNKEMGYNAHVTGADFSYILRKSIVDGINSCDDIRGYHSLPRQIQGSFESGKRR